MNKPLLQPQQLYDYQRECIMHQLQHSDSMLWLQMGLGKTPITLTSIVERMRAGLVQKTLIFGPLRVIQAVWAREARKWEHTKHLRFSIIHGNKERRERALFTDADIYLINYECMNWLAEMLVHYYLSQDKPIPFDMVVYDEVSKLKNSTTLRMKGGTRDRKTHRKGETVAVKITGWRKILGHFKYRTGLTGTPASNGYLDLHGQFLAVDGGERLGEYITHYKDNYFSSDYNGWKYTPTELGKQWIEHKISDITKKMDAKDYLDLPDCKVINLMVDLPAPARKAYDEVEKQMFTELDSGKEIEVFSRSAVSNKCLQFANGSPYLKPESSDFEKLHDAKLDALESVLEEAGGSPVLCSYSFKADAERIMKKFKKYNPVNLTTTKSKDTLKVIDKWNSGKLKLLIAHPACLHPATEVLTQWRGWVKIINVKKHEKVFDGIEFVSHDGCQYSGYKEVIDVFGITMTPDHKLLINNEWVEGQHVRDCEESRNEAIFKWEEIECGSSEVSQLWERIRNNETECCETQQKKEQTLSTLHQRNVSQHDQYQVVANLDGFKSSCKRSNRQKLWWSRNNNVRRVGRFQKFLQRHERRLRIPFDNRKSKREQRLLQRKLHMGDNVRSTIKQKKHPLCNLSRRNNTFSGVGQEIWLQQNDAHHETQQRNDSRRSGRRCKKITIRKEYKKSQYTQKRKKEDVYDLVNCGPRNRFLIRNNNGEMFISHNSCGHGIDGLQESGSTIVWFGVNWSLELYEQMNGRIDRQGQQSPVSIIRILCRDTVDLAVADAIERKTDDQEGLKAALQRYRDGVTDNDLTVNFF